MANLRIVHVNAADAAVLTGTTPALALANMQTDGRTDVWRSTSTSATVTATFAGTETVNAVALMTGNFTSAATWRVRLFNAAAATLYDSGTVLTCPPRPFGELDWGYEPLGVNAFTGGLPPQAVMWLPTRYPQVKSVQIDIVDTFNPAGYLQASRLVIGEYYAPTFNAAYGMQVTFSDRTVSSRSEDGTLRTETGANFRGLRLSLEVLPELDRRRLSEIARRLGTHSSFLISVYPTNQADSLGADHTMLAKLKSGVGVAAKIDQLFSTQLEMEEV